MASGMAVPLPSDPGERIASIDALRGIALCGILLVNIFQMGGPFAMDRPFAAPSPGNADWQVWIFSELAIAGTMRGLFSLLFGAGLVIALGNDRSDDPSGLYLRRLMILFLFGLANCTLLLWPGDILIIYALAGFVALFLYPKGDLHLLAVAGALLVLITLWGGYEVRGLPPSATVYSASQLAREEVARLGGYWQNLKYMSYLSWALTIGSLSLRWVGDALVMMLIGMVLYRQGLFAGDARRDLLRRMMWAGYGLGLALRLIHVVLILNNDGGPTVASAVVDQPGRVAMTLGHFALFQLLWRRVSARPIKAAIAAMGRMALTLYLGQSLLAALVFSGFGLGWWNSLSWPELWLVALSILAVEALFAARWLCAFRFGPAEWFWRWGIYGQRPTLRR